MLSQPRTARKTSSSSKRSSESGTARSRMTIGLTLRRTARRINRLKEACMLILSGYLPHAISPPDLLLLSYIRNNRGSIPNYGERYRQGETISTAYVESTINQVV